jgi:hypothetical protein
VFLALCPCSHTIKALLDTHMLVTSQSYSLRRGYHARRTIISTSRSGWWRDVSSTTALLARRERDVTRHSCALLICMSFYTSETGRRFLYLCVVPLHLGAHLGDHMGTAYRALGHRIVTLGCAAQTHVTTQSQQHGRCWLETDATLLRHKRLRHLGVKAHGSHEQRRVCQLRFQHSCSASRFLFSPIASTR